MSVQRMRVWKDRRPDRPGWWCTRPIDPKPPIKDGTVFSLTWQEAMNAALGDRWWWM